MKAKLVRTHATYTHDRTETEIKVLNLSDTVSLILADKSYWRGNQEAIITIESQADFQPLKKAIQEAAQSTNYTSSEVSIGELALSVALTNMGDPYEQFLELSLLPERTEQNQYPYPLIRANLGISDIPKLVESIEEALTTTNA